MSGNTPITPTAVRSANQAITPGMIDCPSDEAAI